MSLADAIVAVSEGRCSVEIVATLFAEAERLGLDRVYVQIHRTIPLRRTPPRLCSRAGPRTSRDRDAVRIDATTVAAWLELDEVRHWLRQRGPKPEPKPSPWRKQVPKPRHHRGR